MALHEITPPIRHLWKILVIELMSTRQLESSQYIRMEEMASTLYKIANENGPSCVKTHMSFLNTNVISCMIFNKRLGIKEQESDTKMVHVVTSIIFFQNLVKFPNMTRLLLVSLSLPTLLLSPYQFNCSMMKHGKCVCYQF